MDKVNLVLKMFGYKLVAVSLAKFYFDVLGIILYFCS